MDFIEYITQSEPEFMLSIICSFLIIFFLILGKIEKLRLGSKEKK